ncbi:hypothetical protein [Neptuniibacter sp. QD37_11]|uniref:hypothetical protein n=1 Tax=Neptuniibacter sp. QD37_11 TaxID=3398209 RepID=UPI0039F5831E
MSGVKSINLDKGLHSAFELACAFTEAYFENFSTKELQSNEFVREWMLSGKFSPTLFWTEGDNFTSCFVVAHRWLEAERALMRDDDIICKYLLLTADDHGLISGTNFDKPTIDLIKENRNIRTEDVI